MEMNAVHAKPQDKQNSKELKVIVIGMKEG